ncbi:MAG: carboxypeptidase-like regulatory domain-containing protein, partial [Pyrinomonadaceae bacterium]
MNNLRTFFRRSLAINFVVVLSVALALAQQGRESLRGTIKDELGASIVGATVTITDAAGTTKTTVTNGEGVYTVSGLAPGK